MSFFPFNRVKGLQAAKPFKFFTYIAVAIFCIFIGQTILKATSTDWTFDIETDPSTNYTISDANSIEFSETADSPQYPNPDADGVARLKKLTTWTDTSDTEWNNGTNGVYTNTNSTVDANALQIDKFAKPTYSAFAVKDILSSEPGLYALFRMNEASGNPADSALYAGAQTLTGSNLTYSAAAQFGTAITWNGNDNVATSSRATRGDETWQRFATTSAGTVAAWIYPTNVTGTHTIISKWDNAAGCSITDTRVWRLFLNGTTLSLDFYNTTPTLRQVSGGTVTQNAWNHVAFVKDGTATNSRVALYLNGKRTHVSQPGGTFRNVGPILNIGGNREGTANGCYSQVFAGRIDDVGMFTAFKTQDEIRQIYGDVYLRSGVFSFDGQNGNDSSGWANNLSGTATYTDISAEKPGFSFAANFDGSQNLDLGSSNSVFDPVYELTMEAWIKPTSVPGSGSDAFLMTSTTATSKYDLRITTTAAGTFLKVGWGANTFVGRKTLSAGTWYHVAAVIEREVHGTNVAATTGSNEGKVRLYVNGILDSQGHNAGVLNYGDAGFRLGQDSAGANGYNGLMDEVLISNRVKTTDEILNDAMAYNRMGVYRSAGRTSGTFDAGTSRPWNHLAWTEGQRYGDGASTVDSNLAYLYRLDESSAPLVNAMDLNNGPTLSVTSGTTTTQGLLANPDDPTTLTPKARYFTNTVADRLTSDAALNSLAAYTIEAYVRFAVADNTLTDTIFSIGANNPRVYRDNAEKIVFNTSGGTITGTHDFKDTRWHHIAVTVNGTNANLYVDGILEGTSPSIGAASTAGTLYLGDDSTGTAAFNGTIDEFVIYNTDLNQATIQEHYKRMILNIRYLSHSCAATGSTCNNADFQGYNQTAKPTIPVAADAQGLVINWNFDESSYSRTALEVQDSQINAAGKDAVAYGVQTSPDALFGRSAVFNGVSDYIVLADSNNNAIAPRISLPITIWAWIKLDEEQFDSATSYATIFAKMYSTNQVSYGLYVTNHQQLDFRIRTTAAEQSLVTTLHGEIPLGEWTLVGATYAYNVAGDNYVANVYINPQGSVSGTASYANTQSSILYDNSPLYVGNNHHKYIATARSPFRGKIDAIGIYDGNALDQSEFDALYAKGNPNHYVTDASNQDPGVANNQYFQYKAILLSDGSESPQLQDVTVKPTTFDTLNPTIETKAGNSINYVRTQTFAQTLGSGTGTIKYLFKNGAAGAWYWWDAGQGPANKWVVSNGTYAQTTAVADLTDTNFQMLDDVIGINGILYWKAFFNSPTGEEGIELDNVNIVELGATTTFTAPEGQTLIAGNTMDITWTHLTVNSVKLEWSTDDFTTPNTITNSTPVETDGGTGCTDPGPNAGCYRVTVPDALSSNFKIRITDIDPAEATPDISSPANTVNGQMAITYPAGSETLTADTVYTILWTANGSTGSMAGDNTRIEYDPDAGGGFGGGDVVTIASNAVNGANTSSEGSCTPAAANPPIYYGCYKYKLPATLSNGSVAQIRVTDPHSGAPQFVSTSSGFTVAGSITPSLSPSLGGTAWKVETGTNMSGTTIDLTWTYKGSIGNVDLQFDKTGDFSGSQRVIKSGGTALDPETSNGTGCTDPGVGAGCYRLDISEVPTADELTHGSTTAKFRLITTAPNPDVVGMTTGFEVRGWYQITAPAATATWRPGENRTISWDTHGNNIGGGTGNVLVQYNNNSGSGAWTTLNSGAADLADADGSHNYSWNPVEYIGCYAPERGCDKVRLRVVAKDAATIFDQPGNAGAEFDMTILPELSVSVAGSPTLLKGSARAVSWTIGGLLGGTVDVYFSTNDDFSSACNSSNGNGKCTVCLDQVSGNLACGTDWTIPNNISTNVKLKVVSDLDANIAYTQTSANRIHGQFAIAQPIAGTYQVGDAMSIEWSESTGATINNVHLWYSVDNFSSATLINSGATSNDSFYDGAGTNDTGPWTIPSNVIHNNLKIRVSDSAQYDAGGFLDSAALSPAFSSAAKLRIVAPIVTDEWAVGSSQTVTWGYKGSVSNVALKYCTDGTITCGSPGTIVASVAANNNPVGCDPPAPSGGETFGCYVWADAGTSGVADIRGTQVKVFAQDLTAGCTPSACTPDNRPTVNGGSPAFKVVAKLDLTYPEAAAIKLDANTAYNITWTSQGTGITDVNLYYSNNDGSTFPFDVPASNPTANSTQAGTPGANNSLSWTTPNAISTGSVKYKIKLEDPDGTNYANVEDISDNAFDVVALFTPSAPAGGSSYKVLQNTTVSWTKKGTVSQAQVQYSNDFLGWTTIIQNPVTQGETLTDGTGKINAGSGSFTWKIPNVVSIIDNNVRVRVIDADAGHVLRDVHLTTGAFSIVANINMIDPPEAGQTWRQGQTRVIRWYTKGHNPVINTVDIQYSTDDDANATTFDNPQTIILNADHGTNTDNGGCSLLGGLQADETEGCYSWDMTGAPVDGTVYVRVRDSDAGNPASEAVTGNGVSSVFSISQPETVTITAPVGATMVAGTSMDVAWSFTGPVTAINLDWTKDGSTFTGGTNGGSLAASIDPEAATGGCTDPGANAGCARVTVPDAISATFQVRISDANDAYINNLGGVNTVNGQVDIVSPAPPAATETYIVGNTMTIKWVAYGSIGTSNDTAIIIDRQFAGSNFTNPGVTTITTTATNNNNGFGCVPPVVSAPQYGGCYEWTITDVLSNAADAKVRVTDGSWSAASDLFTVTGSVTLTKPTASDVWKAETATDINDVALYVEWTYRSDNIGTLTLWFDDDGTFSGGERQIKTGLVRNTNNGTGCTAPGGGGCYVLSGAELPNADELTEGALSGKFRLIATTPNPDVTGTGAGIEVRGWYNVTQPTGVDSWSVGETTRQIFWETHGNGMGNVDVQYKVDTGVWQNITTNLADADGNSNSHTWASVQDAVCPGLSLGCNKVKVRIKQTGAGTINDESPDFTIKPRVSITTPADPKFQIGATTKVIQWANSGTLSGNVAIYYSKDQQWANGCNSSTGTGKCSVCSAAASALECTWPTVPDTPSETIRFRAEAVLDTTINSTTTSDSRVHGKFSAGIPACAPNCFSEDSTNMTWTQDAGTGTSIPNVRLEWSVNDFVASSVITASTSNDGLFNGTGDTGPFSIPENVVHDNIKVRISDAAASFITDSAGASSAFSAPARIRLITPSAAGQVWQIGQQKVIEWGYKGTITNVAIKYCTDGTYNCGSPNTITASVGANNDPAGCDPPAGNPGETTGCYVWQDATTTGVANTRINTAKIFIEDADAACTPSACASSRPKVNDGSDNNFKIVPYLAFSEPTTNQELDAATTYDIKWNSQGTPLASVDLVQSTNGGTTFPTNITLGHANTTVAGSVTLNTRSPQWTSPNLISDTGLPRSYVLRVRDPDTTNYLEGKADVPVKVVAKFNFADIRDSGNNPVTTLLTGNNYTVNWTTKGAVNNIKLQYYTDERGSYTTIAQTGSEGGTPSPTATTANAPTNDEASNTGTFNWKIPDVVNLLSTTASLRFLDGDDTHVLRTTPSDSTDFTILPNLQMIYPVGAESLDAGVTINIQWKTVATLAKPSTVDLEYSLNGGAAWTGTIATDLVNGQNSGCTLPSVNAGETAGCYNWKIHANAVGANVKFRVKDSDLGHPDSTLIATNGVTPASFVINKSITILSPVQDDQLTVGGQWDIKWEAYGSVGNVDIEYSGDAFATEHPDILMNATHDANGTGCSPTSPTQGGVGGCYRWDPIPSDIRPGLTMRIKEINAPNTTRISDSFEIVGPLAISSPNGGANQVYKVGDLVNINWSNNQLLPIESPIDLEYTPDGTNWYQVRNSLDAAAEGVANSGNGGTYEWKIPDDISDTVRVRIIKQNTPSIGDQSNATFKILGKITLVTLSSGDAQYAISNTIPIQFNVVGTPKASLFDDVTIRYSTDNTFQTGVVNITTGLALDHGGALVNCTAGGACSFNWTIDTTNTIVASPVYYLQVIDSEQTQGAVTSTNKFHLYGKLTLSSAHPCGVDNICYISESPQPQIVFTKNGNSAGALFDAVNIEYSNDDFASDVRTIASNWALDGVNCPAGTCTYSWNITPGSNTVSSSAVYKVRVVDPDNTVSVSTGGSAFELAGKLTLTTINPGSGDAIYKIGDTVPIQFTKAGNANGTVFNDVKIQYSTQSDFSAGVVDIDPAFLLDATNCPAGSCTKSWTISDSNLITSSAVYYLRAYDPDNTDSTTGASSNRFELRGNLVLTILTSGNQTYKIGDTVNITWEKDGLANAPVFDDVNIQYSDDNFGSNIVSIGNPTLTSACSGSFPNETCTYSWVLDNADPIITGQNYKMRIVDPNNSDSVTISTNSFKIAGDLTLTTLMGVSNATYHIGQVQNITWTSEGQANGTVFDRVDIKYSNDDFGSNSTSVVDNILLSDYCSAGNCTYPWTIPGTAVITSTQPYKFRIIDNDNPNDSVTTSTRSFRLAGYVNLSTQTIDATYSVGQVVPITFAYSGAAQGTLFNDVHIQYSNNEFGGDLRTVANNQSLTTPVLPFSCGGGNCTYNWTVPNSVTLAANPTYRLRVIDPDNSDGSTYSISISGGRFALIGGFAWSAPIGAGNKWSVNSDRAISWVTTGLINNYKISSSTDDFTTQKFYDFSGGKLVQGAATTFGAASSVANTANGTHNVTLNVPDTISTNFKLRVYDASNANVYADTVAVKVHSKFTVTSPDSSNKIANTLYNNSVTWTTAGTVNKVKLEYNLDGGAYAPITAAQSGSVTDDNGIIIGNPGSINWATPIAKAATTLVRVSFGNADNTPDTDTSGVSSGFKLSAKITVLAPNAENDPLWRVGETSRQISWTTLPASLGGSNQVDILYSINGAGGPYNFVTSGDNTSNSSPFAWNPIPDSVSNSVFVRVIDSADSDGIDTSNAAFSIAGDLSISGGAGDAPIGGEQWAVYKATPAQLATTQQIKWHSTGTLMNQVEIRASNDGFASSNVLLQTGVTNNVGANTFNWNISDSVSPVTGIGNWQIKVLNITPGTPAEEVISNIFTIEAGFYMSSHNTATEKCSIGQTCTITWDTAGSVNDVKLEYSTSGPGGPWTTMHGGATLGANPGTINWSVPNGLTPGTTMRYRVSDAVVGHPTSTDVTDISSKLVATIPSANILLSPSGQPLTGQTFAIGQTITVNYTYVGVVGAVDVQMTKDEDSNPATFDNPVTIVTAEPTNGNGTGTFSYQFTDLMAGGADVSRLQMRILDAGVPDNDSTNVTNGVTGTFKLKGTIVVTSPTNGTARWIVGNNYTITWTHAGDSITAVKIEYDDNSNFTSPTTIIASTASTAGVGGSYGITINQATFPDINTLYHNDIFIRVSDADTLKHGVSNDRSDNGHLIVGKFDFTQLTHAPTLGSAWDLGSPHTITWYTYGNMTNVNVYYSYDGTFGNAVLINSQITSEDCTSGCVNNPDADTSVAWTPASNLQVTASGTIFIEDRDDNTTPANPSYKVQQTSPTFRLHGQLTLTAPLLDAQKLKASNTFVITWNTYGDTINNVDIEYSRDNDANLGTFDNPQPIAMNHNNTGPTRGTYTWTIPSTFNDSTVYVRIRPVGGSDYGKDESGAFKIMPKITMVTPAGNEQWKIGTPQDIAWSIQGVVASVKIRYSTDDGTSFPSGAPYEIVTMNPNNAPYALTGASAKHNWQDAATGGVGDTRAAGTARIKLELLDDPTGDADAVSNAFSIQAQFTLTAPTAGTELEVYDAVSNPNTHAVSWSWGGTIPNVLIEYSDSYDGSNAATFDAGKKCLDGSTPAPTCSTVPNGAGATGNFSYNWQVPDDISRPGDANGDSPYYVRISDPGDSNVYHIFPSGAGNGLKIKSKFTVSSPNGAEDMLVGTNTYSITWQNSGTVPNVVLEYSQNNFVLEDLDSDGNLDNGEDTNGNGILDGILCVAGGTYPNCNAVANDGAFNGTNDTGPWRIADDGKLIPYQCNTLPDPDPNDTVHPCKVQTTKIRVKDASDSAVLDPSNNNFTTRYTAKKWYIRNAVTGADLDSINMVENTIHKIRAYGNLTVPAIVSPYTIWSPSGQNYRITFQKDGYTTYDSAAQVTVTSDVIDAATINPDEPLHAMIDERQTVFLSDIVAHNDVINTTFTYNESTDTIIFNVWYSRDGLNVVTTKQANLLLYDGNVEIVNQVLTTQTPTNSGVYIFTLAPSGLQKNKDYFARNKVRLPTDADLQGFTVINITSQSSAQTTDANVATITPIITANVDRQLSVEFDEVKQKIDDVNTQVTTTLNNKIGTDPQGKTLFQKMDDQTNVIQTAIDDFVDKSDDAIAKLQDEIAKGTIRLIIPDTTKVGTTETLRVGTAPGTVPTLDLLCPDGSNAVSSLAMTEDSAQPGIYAVDVQFSAQTFKCAIAKAVTIVANVTIQSSDPNDPAFTATAIGSIFITSTDLDTIQGLAAAGLNAEKASKEARDAIRSVEKAVKGDGNVQEALAQLQDSVTKLPQLLSQGKGSEVEMKASLDEVANQLATFMGSEGFDVRTIIKQEIGEGIKGVRNKVDQTVAATEVVKEIIERKVGKSDEPIIQTFYEIGSVKMRVVAVNPSSDKNQTVPIKIYLPKEVIPDDIISMGELKVGYDSSKGQYYAFSDGVELAPQETRVFEVHLEDVWQIPNEELDKLRTQTERALKHLEGTEYFDQAKTMVDGIHTRLKEIVAKQSDDSVSREEHIGAYRINLIVMDKIKQDIAIIEKMLQHTGNAPSVEFLKDTMFEKKDDIDRVTAWKLILAIIGFLGLLGIGFYARWFMMIRSRRAGPASDEEEVTIHQISEFAEGGQIPIKPSENQKPGSGPQDQKRKAG